jgi:hypothetical protein
VNTGAHGELVKAPTRAHRDINESSFRHQRELAESQRQLAKAPTRAHRVVRRDCAETRQKCPETRQKTFRKGASPSSVVLGGARRVRSLFSRCITAYRSSNHSVHLLISDLRSATVERLPPSFASLKGSPRKLV